MPKKGKLLYHLTSLGNLESIFTNGLQPRAELINSHFNDVADREILASRHNFGLEGYVPFHFFAKNPFDYGVQRKYPDESFVLVTVLRTVAQAHGWKVVPRHPLAGEGYEILSYDDGIHSIDWELIAKKDYNDRACKIACMAECLSPTSVDASKIFSIYAKTETDLREVQRLVARHGLSCHINLAAKMFAGHIDV